MRAAEWRCGRQPKPRRSAVRPVLPVRLAVYHGRHSRPQLAPVALIRRQTLGGCNGLDTVEEARQAPGHLRRHANRRISVSARSSTSSHEGDRSARRTSPRSSATSPMGSAGRRSGGGRPRAGRSPARPSLERSWRWTVPARDIDELAQAIGRILVQRSFGADVEAVQDFLVARGAGRPSLAAGGPPLLLAFADVVADADKHPEGAVVPPRQAHQLPHRRPAARRARSGWPE